MHRFTPDRFIVGVVRYRPEIYELSQETMLFSASWSFARSFGGPLTQRVLDELGTRPVIREQIRDEALRPEINRWIVIDTRVHMLMRGMYPAIPGWHCDGLPRNDKYSQPDIEAYRSDIRHYTCVLSTSEERGISRTEFLDQSVGVDVDPNRVWGSVNDFLEEGYSGDYTVTEQRDGEIIRFDQGTLHRVTPCIEPGWRLFLRLSLYHRRPLNKIRRQVQVYTTPQGW